MSSSYVNDFVNKVENNCQNQRAKEEVKNKAIDKKVQLAIVAIMTGLVAVALTGIAIGFVPTSYGLSLLALVPAAALFAVCWDSHKLYRVADHTVDYTTEKPMNLDSLTAAGQSVLNQFSRSPANLKRKVQQEVDGTLLFRRMV